MELDIYNDSSEAACRQKKKNNNKSCRQIHRIKQISVGVKPSKVVERKKKETAGMKRIGS